MFQAIIKNIQCETEKLMINSQHTKFGIVMESLFWTLNQVHSFFECFYC